MDRKRYMREVYAKSWPFVRQNIYGFMPYDKSLCEYVADKFAAGQKFLEVAIGTGFPFADFFQKQGYSVYGIDIAPSLVEECWNLNSEIECKVGDAEQIDYPDDFFDCTYCFHSTWYFPNLPRALDEMLRVTHPGGMVFFDIQNRNNPKIGQAYQRRVAEQAGLRRIYRLAKNIAKIVLRRGRPVWSRIVHEVPTHPEQIYAQLADRGWKQFQVMVRDEQGVLHEHWGKGSLAEFERLVFAVEKS